MIKIHQNSTNMSGRVVAVRDPSNAFGLPIRNPQMTYGTLQDLQRHCQVTTRQEGLHRRRGQEDDGASNTSGRGRATQRSLCQLQLKFPNLYMLWLRKMI